MSKNIEVLLRAKETAELFGATPASQANSQTTWLPLHADTIGNAEEARLVQKVFILPAHEVPRMVVFSGIEQMDGAGGICARAGQNLASQTGASVCLVDGNFQFSSLHQYFGMNNSQGLSDAVLKTGPIRDFVHSLPGMNVSVLCAGSRSGNTQAFWKSEQLRQRMAELRKEFSYVLIYGPPANEKYMDTVVLGQIADGVILILESMVTRRESARTATENLCAANVNVLGAVLNNHAFSIPEKLYRRL